jgi:flavin reductase (DIM6/NTAB) family NADH-FMN oxidoreductase RutF
MSKQTRTPPSQPRVTALLSCYGNLMPLSWHMPISKTPFRYAVAVRDENVSHALLQEHRSFTLNFMPFEYYETIDAMGRVHGDTLDKYDQSEFQGATVSDANHLLLKEADFIYECQIIDTYQNGDHTIFISDVSAVHVSEDPSHKPALFLGRGRYASITDPIQVELE